MCIRDRFWGLFTAQWNVVVFFLSCVIVAALYGAYSVNKRIFFVQGVPCLLYTSRCV